MALISEDLACVVEEQRLGFVATVGPDGTPNLSPKGTFVVVDGNTLAFAELRSPNTVRNIAERPAVEVNFVDPFSRKGCRFKGRARFVGKDEADFARLRPLFDPWDALAERMRGVVVIDVEKALPITSPAYDIGATEDDLRRQWTENFRAIQPGGKFPATKGVNP